MRGRLIVQAAQSARSGVEGNAALRDVAVESRRCKLVAGKSSREETALVRERLWLRDNRPRQLSRSQNHEMTSVWGIGMTNRPPQSLTKESCRAISAFRFHGRIRT